MVKRKTNNGKKRNFISSTIRGLANALKKDNSRKTLSYVSNFVSGIKPVRYIAGKTLETTMGSSAGYSVGNPIGAIIYGGLDLVKSVSPGVNSSKYVRLLEAAGSAYYGLSTVADLFGILNGDFGQLAKLPLDVAMLYETGKNTSKDYKETNSTFRRDLSGVKQDVKYGADWVLNLFGKKDSGLDKSMENENLTSSEDNLKKNLK